MDVCYCYIVVIILGIVEGLTEFFPVSSSFHVIFIGDLLGLEHNNRIKFLLNIILQLGAVFAVVVVFWKEFFIVLKNMIYFDNFVCCRNSYLSYGHIILGILPVMVLGLIFYDDVKSIFQVRYMFYSFIVGGILLFMSDLLSDKIHIRTTLEVNHITYLQAFLVGCFQCLALCPGFSRSGATVSGGLLVGMSRYVSLIFSFFLAVPIMFSATFLALYKSCHIFVWEDLLLFIIGFCVSFIVSLLTIKIFMRIVRYVSFIVFAIYRFVLAFLLYFFDFV